MKILKKVLFIGMAILLIIQIPFFTPEKNQIKTDGLRIDITDKYEVPMNIQMDLYNGCYDCHSNYTENYPWYYHIQPVSWWMNLHILDAKKHINFSEFAAYTSEEAAEKFDDLHKVMEDRSMPLKSYLWMHDKARLTERQYQRVARWAKAMHDSLSVANGHK